MFTFKEFYSVYDHIAEDVNAIQQRSQDLQKQINDLNTKLQRLLQMKAQNDQQLQQQQQQMNQQTQQKQQSQAAQNQTLTIQNVPEPGA